MRKFSERGEHFHQYDAQANTDALLDNAGAVEARYKYYAFGKVAAVSIAGGAWSATNWDALPLALTTHMVAGGKKHYYLDLETGLVLADDEAREQLRQREVLAAEPILQK